jgi:phospholipid/cholesterol/gamma-HCH transport system substrate-binding protein
MNTSSQRELRDVVVGLGVVILVVGVLAVVFGPTGTSGDETIDVNAVFGRTDGLGVGDPVHAAGVKVGEVAGLDLVEQFRVQATLRIDASIELDADATAAIVTDGIFGGKLVRVDIGGADRIIGDGGRISYTEDAVVLDDLLGLIVSQAKSAREAGAKQ